MQLWSQPLPLQRAHRVAEQDVVRLRRAHNEPLEVVPDVRVVEHHQAPQRALRDARVGEQRAPRRVERALREEVGEPRVCGRRRVARAEAVPQVVHVDVSGAICKGRGGAGAGGGTGYSGRGVRYARVGADRGHSGARQCQGCVVRIASVHANASMLAEHLCGDCSHAYKRRHALRCTHPFHDSRVRRAFGDERGVVCCVIWLFILVSECAPHDCRGASHLFGDGLLRDSKFRILPQHATERAVGATRSRGSGVYCFSHARAEIGRCKKCESKSTVALPVSVVVFLTER
ncbi:hypothetical protein B0H15DRAFT_862655 [Mycena belliarum]|uniref:Uncharacterized protein n=1 Tax=Mycena belliarum TaxID=1033014 RepID=A0AAD6XK97_9AGAR|nr:hypothetical protein B0H15DRAFT_862655 [Mycena belliae]